MKAAAKEKGIEEFVKEEVEALGTTLVEARGRKMAEKENSIA